MTRLAILALCGATLLAPWASMSEAQNKDGFISPRDPRSLMAPMKREGLSTQLTTDASGAPQIESRASRSNFSVYFYGCDDAAGCSSIQFSAGYTLDEQIAQDRINAYNREFRYIRAYLDREGYPVVSYDLYMGGPGLAVEDFVGALDLWIVLLEEFEGAIDW